MKKILLEIDSRIKNYQEDVKDLEIRKKKTPYEEWIVPEITEKNLLISELESLKYFIENVK